VLRDVRNQYITAQSAKKDYGIAIVKKNGRFMLDYNKTAQLRQNRNLTS